MSADANAKASTETSMGTASAAEFLGVSPAFVRRLAANGRIEATQQQVGGRAVWSFEQADLEDYRASVAPQSGAGSATGSATSDESGWMVDMLLAEASQLKAEVLAERLAHAESRLAAMAAENESLRNDNARLRAAVQALAADAAQ